MAPDREEVYLEKLVRIGRYTFRKDVTEYEKPVSPRGHYLVHNITFYDLDNIKGVQQPTQIIVFWGKPTLEKIEKAISKAIREGWHSKARTKEFLAYWASRSMTPLPKAWTENLPWD